MTVRITAIDRRWLGLRGDESSLDYRDRTTHNRFMSLREGRSAVCQRRGDIGRTRLESAWRTEETAAGPPARLAGSDDLRGSHGINLGTPLFYRLFRNRRNKNKKRLLDSRGRFRNEDHDVMQCFITVEPR